MSASHFRNLRAGYLLAAVALLITLNGHFALASLWIEPYAGYEIGDQEQGNTSYDASGINLGIRAGGTYDPFFFGAEYALADLSVERPGQDSDIKTGDWGLVVGASVSILRIWYTHWLNSDGNSDNPNADYSGDGGYKLGVGFNLVSQLQFNVEKTLRKWDSNNGRSIEKIEIDGMMISLSLPFTF